MLQKTILFFLLVLSGQACIWDRDTLFQEASKKPEAIEVIVGLFRRFPQEFYLARSRRLESKKTLDLNEYDDLAVAYERRGQTNLAIQTMLQKKKIVDARKDATMMDRYRTLANLGTFYAHKWFKEDHTNRSSPLLTQSIELLHKAIEINPDAHFGREFVQLGFLEWLKGDSREKGLSYISSQPVNSNWSKIEEGLLGLVTMGSAWESPDVFLALSELYSQRLNDSSIAYFANLRAAELIRSKRKPIFTPGSDLEAFLKDLEDRGPNLRDYLSKSVRAEYREFRKSADQLNRKLADFVMAGILKGKHPDTSPDFFQDFVEPPVYKARQSYYMPFEDLSLYLAIGLAFLYLLTLPIRKRKRDTVL